MTVVQDSQGWCGLIFVLEQAEGISQKMIQ